MYILNLLSKCNFIFLFHKIRGVITSIKQESLTEKYRSGLAPPPGLEPGTCGLTVRRSNRLS
jgi:hypothetical protein